MKSNSCLYLLIYVVNVQTEGNRSSRGFATRLGRGLDIGSLSQSSQSQSTLDVIRCPPVLELRQLLQYQPISQLTRAKSVASCTVSIAVITREQGGSTISATNHISHNIITDPIITVTCPCSPRTYATLK